MNDGIELIDLLTKKIEQDTLVLPTLPAIAMQVSDETSNPDASLKGMHDIIIKDPALSTRVVKVANTVHIGKTKPVTGLNRAITRIGLKKIKNIAMGLAMEQLFETDSPFTKVKLKQSWDNTVAIVGSTIGVYNTLPEEIKREFCVDTLMLAGLVHNIGCLPIYKEAHVFGDSCYIKEFMDPALDLFSSVIGGKILDKWGFDPVLVEVASKTYDFNYLTKERSYVDLLRLGMVADERQRGYRNIILNDAKEKGLFESVAAFLSDEYVTAKANTLSIFE